MQRSDSIAVQISLRPLGVLLDAFHCKRLSPKDDLATCRLVLLQVSAYVHPLDGTAGLANDKHHRVRMLRPVFQVPVIFYREDRFSITVATHKIRIARLQLHVQSPSTGPSGVVFELDFAVNSPIRMCGRTKDVTRFADNSMHLAKQDQLTTFIIDGLLNRGQGCGLLQRRTEIDYGGTSFDRGAGQDKFLTKPFLMLWGLGKSKTTPDKKGQLRSPRTSISDRYCSAWQCSCTTSSSQIAV